MSFKGLIFFFFLIEQKKLKLWILSRRLEVKIFFELSRKSQIVNPKQKAVGSERAPVERIEVRELGSKC